MFYWLLTVLSEESFTKRAAPEVSEETRNRIEGYLTAGKMPAWWFHPIHCKEFILIFFLCIHYFAL